MDIMNRYEEIDEDILPVEVVDVKQEAKPIIVKKGRSRLDDPAAEALERERLRRKLEIAEWAEELKIVSHAPPNKGQIETIYNKLLNGYKIKDALEGICSYSTWRKWQKEYPELMEMEEEARQRRIWDLQEKQRRIADGEDIDGKQIEADKDSIKKITRAKLRIDTMQSEIDRYDRLTAARNGKAEKNSTLVPIQINVGYGRKA